MQEEIWKDVVGYEGSYQVSNFGKVKSLDRIDSKGNHRIGKSMKISLTREGYNRASLCKDGVSSSVFVHRAVAQAFIPNPENKPEVNHINCVPSFNCVENLEWCTTSENHYHGYKCGTMIPPRPMVGRFGVNHSKSKSLIQETMDGVFVAEYGGLREASRMTGIANSLICHCCKGKYVHAGGYKWKYKV